MRLRHPEQGTVVEIGDDLAETYQARGWVEADAAPRRRRSAKKDDEDAGSHDHD